MAPKDYPMVAPANAARRSALAKQFGLGRKPAATTPPRPRAGPGGPRAAAPGGRAPEEGGLRRKRTDGGGETPLPPPFR